MNRPDPAFAQALRRWSVHLDTSNAHVLRPVELRRLARRHADRLPSGTDPRDLAGFILQHSGGRTAAVQSFGAAVESRGTGPVHWRYGLTGLTIAEFGLHVPNGFSRNIYDAESNVAAACALWRSCADSAPAFASEAA